MLTLDIRESSLPVRHLDIIDVRANIAVGDHRDIPISEAKEAGAMMLFGEKYGDQVRMISFDSTYSVELCGGCHVANTGNIGYFKILSESAIAAGVRRIEAVTANAAEFYIDEQLDELNNIRSLFKNPVHTIKNIEDTLEENKKLKRELQGLMVKQAGNIKDDLIDKFVTVEGKNILIEKIPLQDSKAVKTLAFNLEKSVENAVIGLGFESNNKPQLMILIDKNTAEKSGLNAGSLIREIAKEINGGGGGQAHFATAGGSKLDGIDSALVKLKELIHK